MLTLTATALLVTLTVLAARPPAANAYHVRDKPAGYVDRHLHLFRVHTNTVRAAKCLPRFAIGLTADELPPPGSAWRRAIRIREKGRHWRAQAARSRCAPVIPWPWDALARCESGGDWDYNGPSGFDGGLQFLPSTWNTAKRLVPGASEYAYAWQAPAVVQVRVAQAWLAVTSWAQWPACSAALGLR